MFNKPGNRRLFFYINIVLVFLAGITSACGPAITSQLPPKTVTIGTSFQSQISDIPARPGYICGAWSSNESPTTNSVITIYARLTHNLIGVAGIRAQAIVHFADEEIPLFPVQTSDGRGYVSFLLPIEGRQPRHKPATISVNFQMNQTTFIHCTDAFFTPQ